MRIFICVCLIVCGVLCSNAQETNTKNLIVVTIDGFRWKELFGGVQYEVTRTGKYVKNRESVEKFMAEGRVDRRSKLMPFMWETMVKEGQLYGNRRYGNKVNCANNHLLSYPGYSEMFVGYPAKKVTSNERKINPNPTVFEHIQNHPGYHREVAAFSTWDMFPYILREQKSSIHVNAGNEIAVGNISQKEKAINQAILEGARRSDKFTFTYALEYMKREKPRVTFIGFDGTDHNAHHGKYDLYLQSAHEIDSLIGKLWSWVQSDPDYKDQTTLLITTDHGRGNGKHTWKNHRLLARGSRHIWFAVIGPDTPPMGELKSKSKYFQKQIAGTLAAFLGMEYQPTPDTGAVVRKMISAPAGDQPVMTRENSGGQRE